MYWTRDDKPRFHARAGKFLESGCTPVDVRNLKKKKKSFKGLIKETIATSLTVLLACIIQVALTFYQTSRAKSHKKANYSHE